MKAQYTLKVVIYADVFRKNAWVLDMSSRNVPL